MATIIFRLGPNRGALPAAQRILLNCWIVRAPLSDPVDCRLFKQTSTDSPEKTGAGRDISPGAAVGLIDAGDTAVEAGETEEGNAGAGDEASRVGVTGITGAVEGEVLTSLAGAVQPIIREADITRAEKRTNNLYILSLRLLIYDSLHGVYYSLYQINKSQVENNN